MDERIQAVLLWLEGKTDAEIGKLLYGDAGDYQRNVRRGREARLQGLKQLGFDGTGNDILRQLVAERLAESNGLSDGTTDDEPSSDADSPSIDSAFAEMLQTFERWIGRPSERIEPKRSRPASDTTKIAVISDLHFPYANKDVIQHLFQHHSDADILVVLGDMFDCYSASRFRKERNIDIRTELAMASAFVESAAKTFGTVYLVKGNHDGRPIRWLQDHRPEIAPLMLHPYDYIRYTFSDGNVIPRFSNVHIPKYRLLSSSPEYPVYAEHFVQIGDALLGHFEKSNKGPLRTVYMLSLEWLPQWRSAFGLGEVRCLVQAHVHRLGKSVFGDVLLFESGCASHPMDYVIASPNYGPPQLGYVILYQTNGVTDWNRSFYYIHR